MVMVSVINHASSLSDMGFCKKYFPFGELNSGHISSYTMTVMYRSLERHVIPVIWLQTECEIL